MTEKLSHFFYSRLASSEDFPILVYERRGILFVGQFISSRYRVSYTNIAEGTELPNSRTQTSQKKGEDFLLFSGKTQFFVIKTHFVTHYKSMGYKGDSERKCRHVRCIIYQYSRRNGTGKSSWKKMREEVLLKMGVREQ